MAKRPTGYYGWLETQEKKHKSPPPAWSTETRPRPQHTTKQQITLVGYDYVNATNSRSFSTLAGDTAPTITGGHIPKINVIDRPQRRGLTQFVGYDPPSMQISLRFMLLDTQYGWLTNDDAGAANETDIEALEWMGGHGQNVGTPPIVYASTYDSSGNTTALIPFPWQLSDTHNIPKAFQNKFARPWLIQDLQWDQSPVKNSNGYRIKQDATVTLVEYETISGQASGSAAQRNRTLSGKAGVFHAKPGENTPLKIAGSPSSRAQSQDRQRLALAIIKDPANKHLHLRGVNSTIRKGATVHIPAKF